jgi:hypothetical protein
LLNIIGHRPSERAENAGLEETVDVPVRRLAQHVRCKVRLRPDLD